MREGRSAKGHRGSNGNNAYSRFDRRPKRTGGGPGSAAAKSAKAEGKRRQRRKRALSRFGVGQAGAMQAVAAAMPLPQGLACDAAVLAIVASENDGLLVPGAGPARPRNTDRLISRAGNAALHAYGTVALPIVSEAMALAKVPQFRAGRGCIFVSHAGSKRRKPCRLARPVAPTVTLAKSWRSKAGPPQAPLRLRKPEERMSASRAAECLDRGQTRPRSHGAGQDAAVVRNGDIAALALPLPQIAEPLVKQSDALSHPAPVALPRTHLPAVPVERFAAQIEAWVRQVAKTLTAMVNRTSSTGKPGSRAPARKTRPTYRGSASVPAIARANREILALREENRRLQFELAMLQERRERAEALSCS